MAQLYLPLAHTEADLVLAGELAEHLDSATLYVAWTRQHGQAAPEVVAEVRAAVPRWTKLALILQAASELWSALRGRDPQQPALSPAPAAAGPAQARSAPGEAA
jgi:hypothetical protein